jgi:hypothetical protein
MDELGELEAQIARVEEAIAKRQVELHSHSASDKEAEFFNERMRQLQVHCRALCSRRNALTPLCRLPIDILIHILHHLVWDSQPPTRFDQEPSDYRSVVIDEQDPQDWTRVLGVCTHIRNIALESPSLWTCISLRWPPERWQLSLERSGAAPLFVCVTNKTSHRNTLPRIDHSIPYFAQVVSRAHHACIWFTQADEDELMTLLPSFCYHWPALRSLVVHFGPLQRPFSLPPVLLGGSSTNLTDLFLSSVNLIADGSSFPALVRLQFVRTVAQKARYLWSFIQGAPALRCLYLSDVRIVEPAKVEVQSVQLPRLLRLQLSVTLQWMMLLIRALPLPRVEYELNIIDERASSSSLITRAQDYDMVHRLFEHQTAHVPEAAAAKLAYRARFLHGHRAPTPTYDLTLRCTVGTCAISFKHHIPTTLAPLKGLLGLAREVHVAGGSVDSVFKEVLRFPGLFASSTHVVITGWCGPLGAFLQWLEARAQASNWVKVVDFQQRTPDVVQSNDSMDSAIVFITSADPKLVEEVCVEGIAAAKPS